MGGKGQRRREKNYRAAHGGSTRLPPPPDPSSCDALPSKLRKILSFSGAAKKPSNATKINAGGGVEKSILSGEECDSTTRGTKRARNDPNTVAQHMEHGDQHSSHEKKKRKRKGVKDLRFDGSEGLSLAVNKRKERKKQRLKERKKKHRNARTEEDFQGHEEIKFGEVVEAPPKLIAIPKVLKTTQDASQERLRLQAVEAYRKRKGWTSRLGVQLPSLVTP